MTSRGQILGRDEHTGAFSSLVLVLNLRELAVDLAPRVLGGLERVGVGHHLPRLRGEKRVHHLHLLGNRELSSTQHLSDPASPPADMPMTVFSEGQGEIEVKMLT